MTSKTNFIRVGGRDYIQGIAIAQAMAEAVLQTRTDAAGGVLKIDLVKFPHKTLCNGTIHVADIGDTAVPIETAAGVMNGCWESGETFFAVFLPDPDQPVIRQIERDDLVIRDLECTDHFSAGCFVTWKNQTQFLKTLVEVNKQTILQSIDENRKDIKAEIVYARSFIFPHFPQDYEGPLVVKNSSVRTLGSRQYILSVLSWNPMGTLNGDRSIEMAFSI